MSQNITEFGKRYIELEADYKAKTEVAKAAGKLWEEHEAAMLDFMVEEGIASAKLPGIGNFSMSVTNYLSVTKAGTESFYPYLKEAGHGGLLTEYVDGKTVTAFLDQHLPELITKFSAERGIDEVEARTVALDFLKARGVSAFTKRGISKRKAT